LPPGPGRFYPWQLEGCRVLTEDGRLVGEVAAVERSPAHDLWVVRDGAREHLIPAVAEIVSEVDLAARRVDIRVVHLRDYAEGKRRVTDDYQFGGGGGMVLKPEPLFAAVEALRTPGVRVVLLDPRGRTFTQPVAAELARETHLILLAGRYEGVDERVGELCADDAI